MTGREVLINAGLSEEDATAAISALKEAGWSEPKVRENVPLKEYAVDDLVDVVRNGDWVSGVVTENNRKLNLVHVYTSWGPVSVASTRTIRKFQK